MNKNRREFLRLSALLAAGAALPIYACGPTARQTQEGENTTTTDRAPLPAFGIQLYTLKEQMAQNPKVVLNELSTYGYKELESFEGPSGMFWGMSNTDFKKYVEDLGMTLVASHCKMGEGFEEKAEQAAAIGMKYLISPWIGPQDTLEAYKRYADEFNRHGEICRKHGIRFAYHNHEYSFKEHDSQIPHDLLLSNTNPELVDFEMDIYWVVTAGADPERYLREHPGRFRLCHIKDRLKNSSERDASTLLGTGSIDYTSILNTARANGMEHFIVEQERFDNTTPLESAKTGADYLKQLAV